MLKEIEQSKNSMKKLPSSCAFSVSQDNVHHLTKNTRGCATYLEPPMKKLKHEKVKPNCSTVSDGKQTETENLPPSDYKAYRRPGNFRD